MQNNRPLKIVNASAGSGKTYHLVREFIGLLINDQKDRSSFAQIIAMTFTNKAALEMKERIIAALDEIGNPEYYKNKNNSLVTTIAHELNISNEEVSKRCRKILETILHQYENFHVMTIDKFNLRLIKSFGRDLDLPNEFEVVLDESLLLEEIVDNLLNKLGRDGTDELSSLIVNYAEFNLDEGNPWNFRKNLIEFGKILRNERNSVMVDQLLKLNLSVPEFHKLRQEKLKLDLLFQEQAKILAEVWHSENIDVEKLPGKSNTYNPIEKSFSHKFFPIEPYLYSPTFLSRLDMELKVNQYFPDRVKSQIRSLNTLWEKRLPEYAGLDLFLKNFFNMALLQHIADALQKTRNEQQLIRISEFNKLISELIQNESTPFIYERIGNKFNHFLLDEFQDTSRLQWLNLVPLIHESLSHGRKNLIVGDPKQSIYRFKNGVAEQFVALPEVYNPEQDVKIEHHSAYFSRMGEVHELESNWRSSSVIVNFNNQFFGQLRNILPDHSVNFYNSVEQLAQSTKPGKVEVISIPEKRKTTELYPMILQWIEESLNDGFDAGDICILGKTNLECSQWAISLHNSGYKVVSSDSLLINTDIHVQLAIAYIKRRLKPNSEHDKKRFAELFFRINSIRYDDYKQFLIEKIDKNNRTYRIFDDEAFLKDYFEGYETFFFKYENLYDLIQGFFKIADYDELANPYLHHLADILFEYSINKGPDLKGFLQHYEQNKNKIAIQIPESNDAIKLMTIHKSKGLEFPIVIIPSMAFSMDVKSHFLIEIDNYVVYRRPSKNESIRVLEELYKIEKDQIFTDNANLCYVAMTRPIERLYIGNYHDKNDFGNLFHQLIDSMNETERIDDKLTLKLSVGHKEPKQIKLNHVKNFQPFSINDKLWFPDIALQDKDELKAKDFLNEPIQFGLQFHLLISRIEHRTNIDEVIQNALKSGEIEAKNILLLSEKLNKIYDLDEYCNLFTNLTTVINEQSIIISEHETIRPDKVIIKEEQIIVLDYKTGLPQNKDKNQVKRYCQEMTKMYDKEVTGYLFYTSTIQLIKIY